MEEPGGLQSMGSKESDTTEQLTHIDRGQGSCHRFKFQTQILNHDWIKHPCSAPIPHCLTGIPHFSTVHFTPFFFPKRPTWVPIFTNLKKSKEDFSAYRKIKKYGKKQKEHSAFVLQWAPQADRGPATHAPCEPRSTSQLRTAASWNHLCFIWIYSVHPLERCVLR